MRLHLGYLVGTAIFAAVLVIAVSAQISAKRFHPFLYGAVIVATTTVGTTLADFFDLLGFFQLLVQGRICLPSLGAQGLKFPVMLAQMGVHIRPVAQVVGYGPVDFFQFQNRERLSNAFRGRSAEKGIRNRFQGNAGAD